MLVRLVFIRYNIDQTKAKVTLIDVIAVDDNLRCAFYLFLVITGALLKENGRD